MGGSPLVRALLAFFVIALLGWPLWRLTRPEEVEVTAPMAAAVAEPGKKAIQLHLTFTRVPHAFVVKHLDHDVWTSDAPKDESVKEILLDYPQEGVDLQFHVAWPDEGTPAAMRVQLTDPAGDLHEKTIWGKGTVDEVLTFP